MELSNMDFRDGVVLIHAISAAAGLGTVFTTDYLLMKFIKNGRMGEKEIKIMKSFSEVIWISIIALLLTGVYLAATRANILESSKFLLKLVVVGIVFINGIFLNVFVTPKMSRIAFREGDTIPGDEPDHIRKIAVAAGAISGFSWLLAFLLGKFRSIPISFAEGLGGYIVILGLIALAVSFSKKKPAAE